MAKKKSTPQWQLDLLGLGLSGLAGFVGSFGMNQANVRFKKFEDNPVLAPLGLAAVGSTLVFLTPKGVKPFGHGLVAVSGGSGADMLVNGLSRIEIQGDAIQGRIEQGEGDVQDITDQNEAIQNAVIKYQLQADDDGT